MISKSSMIVIVCLLLLGVFSSHKLETEAQDAGLVTVIASQLIKLLSSETVDFVGYDCQHRIRPKFRKFKLKWEGKFWCPGVAPFDGRGLRSSRSGAVEEAIRDFAKKAVQNNIVTQDQVDLWLKNFQ